MNRSIHKIIDEHIKRCEMQKKQGVSPVDTCNVITISRQRGSRGHEVAEALAKALGFDLFDYEIVEGMIKETQDSSDKAKTLVETDKAKTLLETLDEHKMNIVEDLVAALVHKHHLWPDEYSKILLRVLNTIGSHGNAVILGRGANYDLVLNTGTLSVEKAVSIIQAALA